MQLINLSVAELVAGAGGDPWEINRTLQAGQPGQISNLANAFHSAGRSTAEADATFDQARKRFEAAWNHQNGDSPINDSAEVQRTAQALGAQSEQLPKIGADLENIAAALADAQKSGAAEIATLERQLQLLDKIIGAAKKDLEDGNLSATDRSALQTLIKDAKADAVDDTREALNQMRAIRDGYANSLHHAQKNLADDGYDPARVLGVDGHAAETPESAKQDVHDALGGDKGAAARVNGVLQGITPDQLAGKVPLTAEQASVLSQLQAQEHGMTIDALKTAEERLGDEKGMIGDSWQLMSNSNLTFPKTDTTVGADQGSDMLRGGMAQLPDSVQQVLNAPGWLFADQTRTVANIVKDGNPALQRNTGVDQGLLHKGAQIMTQDWARNTFDQTVESVFWAAGRDHAAVNWIVNQQGICDQSTQDFLKNITHHTWSDGGDAAGSLFSWTKDAAGPEAQIAGQTAQTVAGYLGQNSHDLLNMDHHTLGQIDPKLTQAFATGLAPYVTNIAGGTNDLSPFFHTPDSNLDVESRLPVAKGIFSVLSSDKDASNTFNGAAMQQIMQDQNRYAEAVAQHVPGAVANDADLQQAATLKALVDVGVNNATHAEGLNGAQQATEAYNRKASAYESLVKGGGTVAGLAGKALPPPYNLIGTLGGPALGMGGDALKQDIIGAPPSSTNPPDVQIPHMQDSTAYQQVLDGLVTNHVPIGLTQQFFAPDIPGNPNGPMHIATYDEYRANGGTWDNYKYNQALKGAVQAILGDETIIPHMQHQYDEVAQLPNP